MASEVPVSCLVAADHGQCPPRPDSNLMLVSRALLIPCSGPEIWVSHTADKDDWRGLGWAASSACGGTVLAAFAGHPSVRGCGTSGR